MIILNKKHCLIFIIVFFIFAKVANASFEITEVMYDLDGTDTDREWVEVHNVGSVSEDLSKWYLFSDNSKHTLIPQGDSNISPGGYAVIVQNVSKFITDWPNYSGLLFDSSWTGFNNESEEIALKDTDLNIVSPVSINSSLGGAGNGNSLQLINNSWQESTPTPGEVNKISSSSNTSNNTDNSTQTNPRVETVAPVITNNVTNGTHKKEIENSKIITQIISKSVVVAGIPFDVDHETTGLRKEKIIIGKFIWNFGDGMVKMEKTSPPFKYVYEYPGEYVMTLSYYDSILKDKPDAVDRLIIKVIPSGINISSVGDVNDPYVEIENNSSSEIALYGWLVKGSVHYFLIPEGTVILANKKLRLSPKLTGFDVNDLNLISIVNETGEVLAKYPKENNNISFKNSNDTYKVLSKKVVGVISDDGQKEIIDLNNLEANALNSGVPINNNIYAWIGLVVVIFVGIASFVMFGKNNNTDYVENEINAKDMTIIE